MRKKLMWIAAAVVLVAIPAVVGLVVVGGDDERRSGALVAVTGGHDNLVIPGVTPSGQGIEVMAFSWGVTQVGYATSAGGAIAGKATFQDFHITKTVDAMSSKLILYAANGKHIPDMTFTVRKSAADAPQTVMTYRFRDVIVTAVQHSGNNSDEIPMESVSFNYSNYELTTYNSDLKGTATQSGKMMWDLKANVGS